MRRFDKSVGREELGAALVHSGDPRAARLMETLFDPAYARFSLARLAERAGLNMVDLVDFFRRFYLDLGILRLSRLVPNVLEDTAIDALSRQEYCRRCDSTGEVEEQRVCPACGGQGHVRVAGDKDARKVVFTSAGLLGRNAMPFAPPEIHQNIGQWLKQVHNIEPEE